MLDIATIYACLFMTMVISAGAMFIVWMSNKQEIAAAYWTLAYGLGTASALALFLLNSFGTYINAITTTMVVFAHVFIWSGFRAFNGKITPWSWYFPAPALYLVVISIWPNLYQDLNQNAAVQCVLVAILSFSNAYALLTGKGNRELPMALPTVGVLALHGTARSILVYLLTFHPSPIADGRMSATWWKYFLIEIFFNTTLMAISNVILIKDRAEQRHRIASETDSLTGIANRRAFVQKAEALLAKAEGATVLAIFDLDHFKVINDSFGHHVGDRVLTDLSALLQVNLPKGAFLGRMGGEEFAVFLPATVESPARVLEMLCLQVRDTEFRYDDIVISLSLSGGFADVATAGNDFGPLFAAADCALYVAKYEGRDNVKAYSPSQHFMGLAKQVLDPPVILAAS